MAHRVPRASGYLLARLTDLDSYYLFRADFTTKEFGPASSASVLETLLSLDWDTELRYARELHASGAHSTEPYLQVKRGDGATLSFNLFPSQGSDVAMIMYSKQEFASSRHGWDVPRSKWAEWITRFWSSDWDWLYSRSEE